MRNGAKAEVKKKVKKRKNKDDVDIERERGGERRREGERERGRERGREITVFLSQKKTSARGGAGNCLTCFSRSLSSLASLASPRELASLAFLRLTRLSASSLRSRESVSCSAPPPTAPSSFFIVRPCRAPISFSCTKRDQKRVSCTRRAHPCRHPFPASPKSCHPLPPLLPSPRTLLLSSTHRGFGRDATISLETPAPFTPPPPPPPRRPWGRNVFVFSPPPLFSCLLTPADDRDARCRRRRRRPRGPSAAYALWIRCWQALLPPRVLRVHDLQRRTRRLP